VSKREGDELWPNRYPSPSWYSTTKRRYRVCKGNPGPDASPEGFRVILDREHIEAARATYRENKGMEWRVCQSIGIQVGGNVELRDNLISVCSVSTSKPGENGAPRRHGSGNSITRCSMLRVC
jgi:hypothetical protein